MTNVKDLMTFKQVTGINSYFQNKQKTYKCQKTLAFSPRDNGYYFATLMSLFQ